MNPSGRRALGQVFAGLHAARAAITSTVPPRTRALFGRVPYNEQVAEAFTRQVRDDTTHGLTPVYSSAPSPCWSIWRIAIARSCGNTAFNSKLTCPGGPSADAMVYSGGSTPSASIHAPLPFSGCSWTRFVYLRFPAFSALFFALYAALYSRCFSLSFPLAVFPAFFFFFLTSPGLNRGLSERGRIIGGSGS